MPVTMREMMQDLEGAGHESGLSFLLVRDDGPIKIDGKPTSLRKYTVVGSFVSPEIFASKKKPGAKGDDLDDPDTLTQLWQGRFSFEKEVVHTCPDISVSGFHTLNHLVECGGLNPGLYSKHQQI